MREYKFDFKSLVSKYDVNTVGLKDILQLAKNVSINKIVDDYKEMPFWHTNTTYLYSGRVTINDVSISTGDIANSFENARTLDKTVAANFLYLKYLMLVSNFFGLNIRYFNYSWHLK